MEHPQHLNRTTRNLFARALTLSLALHLSLAAVAALFPPRLESLLVPESIVMVDLTDPAPPRSGEIVTPTASQTATPSSPKQMMLPSAVEEALPVPEPETEAPRPSPPQANAASLSLGLTRGFFRSLADGETLREDVREYYFELVERVNAQWWATATSAAMEPGRHEALVTITVRKSGELLDVRLVKSSGSTEYDRLIMDALQAASNLPPLPESYPGEFFQAPLRLMAPRGLLFS